MTNGINSSPPKQDSDINFGDPTQGLSLEKLIDNARRRNLPMLLSCVGETLPQCPLLSLAETGTPKREDYASREEWVRACIIQVLRTFPTDELFDD